MNEKGEEELSRIFLRRFKTYSVRKVRNEIKTTKREEKKKDFGEV